jgi:hypothetical protein
MSVALRIRAKLPEGDLNGLAHLGAAVLEDTRARVLVALVGPVAVTENLETGDEVVSLGLEHVELVDSEDARNLLRRLYADRTGKEELPLEVAPPADDPVGAAFAKLRSELADVGATVELNGRPVDLTTGELAP